ncbi:MAG: hypothetical protein M3281_05620, partial [Chloroflexota bacterium]|nr:hypothetical protein [Chloroflexota bacterium]
LAQYTTARETAAFEWSEDRRTLTIRSPFECPDFTLSLPMPAGACRLSLDGRELDEVPPGSPALRDGTWQRSGAEATVCLHLRDGVELQWR